jgi:cobalt-zinc-cadmium efflux system membrane fusion protein
MLLMLGACGGHEVAEPPAAPDLSERIAFAVSETPERIPVATLPAEVVPAPGGRHDLGPGVTGRIVRWHVTEGESVVAGQPLAELTSPELAGLAARQAEHASAIAQAREAVRLAEAGAARGVRSASDAQQARSALAAAQAAWSAARLELASLDTLVRTGDTWVWQAPTAGVVDHVRCSLGGVQASDVCLGLVDASGRSPVVLDVHVPERHLTSLTGRVQADFIAADGRAWTFEELGRAPAIDARTRTRTFRFGLTHAEAPPLQGASGRARLSVPADGTLHQVANSALTWIDGQSTVFVRQGEGFDTEPRPVDVLGRDGGLAVVRGLSDGEEVAVRGVFLLKSLAALEEDAP